MNIEIKRIICATDFSDASNYAVPFAVALAKEVGAELFVSHVIDLSAATMYGEAVVDLTELQNRIKRFAQEETARIIGTEKVAWEPLISVGHVADELSRLAQEQNVDLVVAATHGRSGLKRLILGSVTERLMQILPCPLLAVQSPEAGLAQPVSREIRFRRILIGCDFSPDSGLAVEFGFHLARRFQAEPHLVHVIVPTVLEDLLKPAGPQKEARADVCAHLKEKLAGLASGEDRPGTSPVTALLAGEPPEELVKYAAIQQADLIILGVRGRTLTEKLFVGSTTDRVVRRAPCPVLAIRPKSHEV